MSLENIIEQTLSKFAFQIKGKVLELGPFKGSKTKYLCRNRKLKIIGLDNDLNNKKYAQDYEFFLGDAKNIPFPDESFETVVSFDVIEHIDDDQLFLKESYRVLKRGGIFCIGTPNKNRLSHKLRSLIGRKVSYPYKIDEDTIHLREYTMKELTDLVEKSGFRIQKQKYMWLGLIGIGGFKKFPSPLKKYVHYLMIFARKD